MSSSFPIARWLGRGGLLFARVAAFILSLALLAIPLLRPGVQSVSNSLYGPESPLMNSTVVDGIFRPWLTVVLLICMVGYLYFRARMRPSTRRRLTDLVYLFVVVLLMLAVQVVVYLPALDAPVL